MALQIQQVCHDTLRWLISFSLGPMERTFRACLSSYIVLTICVGITPAIAFAIALQGDRGAVWVTIAGFAALLFTYFWLSRFQLTLTPHSLTYRSLFTGERTVSFADITSSDLYWQRGAYGCRFLLELMAGGRRLRINYKVFSREAVHALFHLLGPNQALEPTPNRA